MLIELQVGWNEPASLKCLIVVPGTEETKLTAFTSTVLLLSMWQYFGGVGGTTVRRDSFYILQAVCVLGIY